MAENLFLKWYEGQTGFYWNWLKQIRNAENGWRRIWEKEALNSRKTIKQLNEKLEEKESKIRYLELQNRNLVSELYHNRNKMYDV